MVGAQGRMCSWNLPRPLTPRGMETVKQFSKRVSGLRSGRRLGVLGSHKDGVLWLEHSVKMEVERRTLESREGTKALPKRLDILLNAMENTRCILRAL